MTEAMAEALDLDDFQHILLTRTPAITGRYEFLTFDTAAGGRASVAVGAAGHSRAGADLHAIAILFSRTDEQCRRSVAEHDKLLTPTDGVRGLSYLDLNATDDQLGEGFLLR